MNVTKHWNPVPTEKLYNIPRVNGATQDQQNRQLNTSHIGKYSQQNIQQKHTEINYSVWKTWDQSSTLITRTSSK